MSTLALLVVLLWIGSGVAVVVGLATAPSAARGKGPVLVSLIAATLLVALRAWVTQAGAQSGAVGPGGPTVLTVRTARCPVVVGPVVGARTAGDEEEGGRAETAVVL
ncbi:hypothetical protein [Streptomyces sp. SID486]|uniref:hypothetical protein n=1 Tax=Streptomyces sp. SID486 TaxID=2690264 RepID=UPI001926F8A7|nr:hypothetical protein [Streptomyces sp. SID486]